MRWNSPVPPRVSSESACVWPRVKSAEPCVRGMTPDVAADLADVLGAAPVGAALLDGDAPPHDVLLELGGGAPYLHEPLGVDVVAAGEGLDDLRRAGRWSRPGAPSCRRSA